MSMMVAQSESAAGRKRTKWYFADPTTLRLTQDEEFERIVAAAGGGERRTRRRKEHTKEHTQCVEQELDEAPAAFMKRMCGPGEGWDDEAVAVRFPDADEMSLFSLEERIRACLDELDDLVSALNSRGPDKRIFALRARAEVVLLNLLSQRAKGSV
jgi:hypothetical protein